MAGRAFPAPIAADAAFTVSGRTGAGLAAATLTTATLATAALAGAGSACATATGACLRWPLLVDRVFLDGVDRLGPADVAQRRHLDGRHPGRRIAVVGAAAAA